MKRLSKSKVPRLETLEKLYHLNSFFLLRKPPFNSDLGTLGTFHPATIHRTKFSLIPPAV